MITFIRGKKYNFKIFLENGNKDSYFYIRAICRISKRTSYINNLNVILSELSVDIDNRKYEDSSWVLPKREASKYESIAKEILLNCSFIDYIESCLDEDRALGEWANIAK